MVAPWAELVFCLAVTEAVTEAVAPWAELVLWLAAVTEAVAPPTEAVAPWAEPVLWLAVTSMLWPQAWPLELHLEL